MSEVASNTPRLMAAAKEFNIGKDTLIDFLVSKGFDSEELKPTAKLSEEMYRVLQSEFQQDKAAKQKAQLVDLPKGAAGPEAKKKRDEEDLSIKKKEAPPVEKPKEEKVPEVEEQPVVSKIEAPEIEAPKVINKIDLDSIDSSTRPKKATKKAVAEVVPEEKVQEEKPPVVAADEPSLIENIKADKIEGPKILGKIELPTDSETRPKKDTEDKRKRKRIIIEKKPGPPPPQQGFIHGSISSANSSRSISNSSESPSVSRNTSIS